MKAEGLEGPAINVKAATVATAETSHHPETMAEVLPVQLPDGQSYFSPAPLRRSSPSQTSFLVASPSYSPSRQPRYSSTEHLDYSSPIIVASPSPIQSPTGIVPTDRPTKYNGSLLAQETLPDEDEEDDEAIAFPSYDIDGRQDDDDSSKADTYGVPSSGSDSMNSTNTSSTPEPLPVAEDDSALKQEPTRHVDYLSHDWREEDIWSSWRHITTNRKTYGQRSRLENASWRTWAKAKYRLRTVSPETLNW